MNLVDPKTHEDVLGECAAALKSHIQFIDEEIISRLESIMADRAIDQIVLEEIADILNAALDKQAGRRDPDVLQLIFQIAQLIPEKYLEKQE